MPRVVYTELKKLQLENTKNLNFMVWILCCEGFTRAYKKNKGPKWNIGNNVIEHSIYPPGFNIRVEIHQLNCEGKLFHISKVYKSQVQPLARILQ